MTPDGAERAAHDACARVLGQGWREGEREGVAYSYTCPSPTHYFWQWYWDSCFHAIAWRHLDPGRARAELESLLAAQREDGFIGHTIFWRDRLSVRRKLRYNVLSWNPFMTASIQPPLLAWAWRIAVGDPAAEPRIARHNEWLREHRTLGDDGLLWIVQPDESGLDVAPKFDAVWGRFAGNRPGFYELVWRNRLRRYDLRAVAATSRPVVCELVTNTLWALSELALGRPSLTPALLERLYEPETGLFRDRVRRRGEEHLNTAFADWSCLAPLALPDLPEDVGRRLVEEHLLREDAFWTPAPIPSVSLADPGFRRAWSTRFYWRGPSWVNSAWLAWLGLKRLGYADAAATLRRRLAETIAASGLREYYHPLTRAGMGAVDFGWSTLYLDVEADEPAAARSYLQPPQPTERP